MAPDNFADEEHFVDMESERRHVRVSRPIINRGNFDGLHLQSRFLTNFPYNPFARRPIDIRPSARQRPSSWIAAFVHEKNLTISEYCGANIDLRRRITLLLRK